VSLTSVQDAVEAIKSSDFSRSVTTLPLKEAGKHILAESVLADRDYPPYDRCMMDGICLPSQYSGRKFTIAGTIHAGESANRDLTEKEVWRINTGAPVPADCDLIVPVEELTIEGDEVTIDGSFGLVPQKFIHSKGSDVKAGEVLLKEGQAINSAASAIIASVGKVEVKVYKPYRVFILTTGQEAIDPTDTPNEFQIRQSHPHALHTALSALGLTDCTHHHLPDDYDSMKEVIVAQAPSADLIITCGAISKGSSDFLGQILRELYGEPAFHGISQRPGKPMAYWPPQSDQPVVCALPGNAISTLVTFHRYVAPVLRSVMGGTSSSTQVTITQNVTDYHLTRFQPVRLLADGMAELHSPQNSGDFSQLSGTDGFVEIPLGTAPVAGDKLQYFPWL